MSVSQGVNLSKATPVTLLTHQGPAQSYNARALPVLPPSENGAPMAYEKARTCIGLRGPVFYSPEGNICVKVA